MTQPMPFVPQPKPPVPFSHWPSTPWAEKLPDAPPQPGLPPRTIRITPSRLRH